MVYKNRNYPRLKEYNYSLLGYYYVTIHNEGNAPLLSRIEPAEGCCRANVKLTQNGMIAKEQLLLLEQRYSYVRIDKYVIMPNHIHAIIRMQDGQLPRPGLPDIVGAYKSLVTREINMLRNTPGRKQFQRSFYDTVIRSEAAYQSCWNYIDGNPDKWGFPEEIERNFRVIDGKL